MPVLINSYTTTEPSRPLMATNLYNTERECVSSTIVVRLHQHATLNNRIHGLLSEYSKLQDNWDQDDAAAPNDFAIQQANFITTLLERMGQPIFHAAPGPNGEIMLDIRNSRRTKSLELIFYPNRSFVVSFSESEEPTQQNFELANLPHYLEWLNKR